jgi:hypothetical protein
MDNAIKVKILKAAQTELMKHSLDTFVDNPPSIVQPVLVPNLNRKSTASDARQLLETHVSAIRTARASSANHAIKRSLIQSDKSKTTREPL